MTIPYQARPQALYATPAQDYIDAVLSRVPAAKDRQRIEIELRARLDPAITMEQAIARYGYPQQVAEFYLASVPLEPAPFFRRVVAALIDIPSVMASGVLFFYFMWKVVGTGGSFMSAISLRNPVAIGLCFATLILMSPMYYVIAETWTSQTVGKAIMGLRTVRESGTKISVGQAIVRQLPLLFSFYAFDVLFALFTRKKQRLFEMLSGTRVVRA